MGWFNRVFKSLAAKTTPVSAWSVKTHIAYPEIQVTPDGSWILRFYAYEGAGVMTYEESGRATDEPRARAQAKATMLRLLSDYRRD